MHLCSSCCVMQASEGNVNIYKRSDSFPSHLHHFCFLLA